MTEDVRTRISEILAESGGPQGGHRSPDELLPLVYADFRRLAARHMRHERPGHTLRPTDLVHEAYLRLVDQSRVDWNGRTHFFAVGAQIMRRLLVDHARRRARKKHGGGWQRVQIDDLGDALASDGLDPDDLIALDRALEKLRALDERQSRVVELRCFAGLKVDEVASMLGVSRRTIEGDWTHARAWLLRELGGPD